MITGVDVSIDQHPDGKAIDYEEAVSKGSIEFAICQYRDEISTVNPFFEADVAGFKKAGALVGAYIFIRPELDIAPQAADMRMLAKFGPTWADIEVTGGCKPPDLRKMWADLKSAAPECSFCSYPAYLRANGPFQQVGHPFIDEWGVSKPPPGAAIWGMTDKAEVPGIPAVVDLDSFVGTRAQFEQLFGQKVAPSQPAPLPAIAAAAGTPSSAGYWLVSAEGQVFAFGDAAYHGSPAKAPAGKVIAILPTSTGRGYRLVTSSAGEVLDYGDARPEVRVF